jgi:hypothetical protein
MRSVSMELSGTWDLDTSIDVRGVTFFAQAKSLLQLLTRLYFRLLSDFVSIGLSRVKAYEAIYVSCIGLGR